MPIPHKGETKTEFISRCMSDNKMKEKRPDEKARFAMCNGIWETEKPKAEKKL